jgi:hypothetical protein
MGGLYGAFLLLPFQMSALGFTTPYQCSKKAAPIPGAAFLVADTSKISLNM